MVRSDSSIDNRALLSLRSIHKSFGHVQALAPTDLEIMQGKVLALVGENGAGKSTLMKIIAGAEMPSGGTMSFEGSPVFFNSPLDARKTGIAIVYQEHALLYDMTVAENLFLGQPIINSVGLLDRVKMEQRAEEVIERLGLDISVTSTVERLSMAERQIVEIARALVNEVKLLILDEPTAALERRERNKLFRIIRDLASRGVTIIFCSHHLNEVEEIAEQTIVLRDGVLVDNMKRNEMTSKRIINAMLDTELNEHFIKVNTEEKKALALAVDLLTTSSCQPFNLRVAKGEILGLAGLDGSGREDILRALFGLSPNAKARSVKVGSRTLRLPRSPVEAVSSGFGFLPADRKAEALFLNQTIAFNSSLGSLKRITKNGFLSPKSEEIAMSEDLSRVSLKYNYLSQEVQELSGGNQQKVVLARWLGRKPEVLLLEEPTRGIDIRAKTEVYALIGEFVTNGGAVIMMSSDIPELVGVAHRVLVFYRGEITADLTDNSITAEAIAKFSYSEAITDELLA